VSEPTRHGENIAEQIQGEDAYGYQGELTLADVWLIMDNIHSSFCDSDNHVVLSMLSAWMDELETLDGDLPL